MCHWNIETGKPLFQTTFPPETIVFFAVILCPITGRIAFPDLNFADDRLFGPANPGVHIPLPGNIAELLHRRVSTPLLCFEL